MKKMILAEKPSVARDIARVLDCSEKKTGYLEGKDYIVSWAVGHLVTLAMPEDYDQNLKTWKMENLPVIPEIMQLKPISGTQGQLNTIKKLLSRKDVDGVICATDAGREGELIFRYIYALTQCKKPVQRLWINSLTDKAIRDGFQKIKPGCDYDRLYDAARCRSEADWLVGLNATRAFTVQHRTMLSVGRVQTPTLAILVNREKEIQNFVSRDYWEVYAHYQEGFYGKWQGEEEESGRTYQQEKAEAVQEKVEGKTGTIVDIKQEEKKERPLLLHDLTELQREGNRLYGFSAQQVLSLAQSLYEKKLITYPRTDCRYLSSDLDTDSILHKLQGYSQFKEMIKENRWKLQARSINDSKVTDHHAIIPTGEHKNLGESEGKIYDLVARRFLANYFPDHLYRVTTVTADLEAEYFISRGKVIKQQGWKELYSKNKEEKDKDKDKDKEEQTLPDLKKGDKVKVEQAEIKKKQTKPPARYTEATILSAMENAGKQVEDEELREAMKKQGLGTPATRAAIIERLLKVGYIERKKKSLIPTAKGMTLVETVPEKLKSPELTGEWEKKLHEIEQGKLRPDSYMAEIKHYTRELVETARSSVKKNIGSSSHKAIAICPLCGDDVTQNKKGYGCSAWKTTGCKFFLGKIAGKMLTEGQVKELLEKGQTKTLKGFLSKKGTKFEAALKLSSQGKIEFVFRDETAF